MSVDKYVKFISEQQKSMVNAGFANQINEAANKAYHVVRHGDDGANDGKTVAIHDTL
jgi:hypothetical protein